MLFVQVDTYLLTTIDFYTKSCYAKKNTFKNESALKFVYLKYDATVHHYHEFRKQLD